MARIRGWRQKFDCGGNCGGGTLEVRVLQRTNAKGKDRVRKKKKKEGP
jgi:hypothetical protein